MKQQAKFIEEYSMMKQILLIGIFFVSALFIETITFLLLGFQALPQYLLLDIAMLLIIGGFVFIIPSFRAQQIIFGVVIFIQIVLSFVNLSLYHIFGTILTIDMINLFVEAMVATESSVVNYGILFLFIFLAILYVFINVLFVKKFKPNKTNNAPKAMKLAMCMVFGFIISQMLGFYTFKTQVEEVNAQASYQFIGNDQSLYDTLLFEAEALKKFGTYGFYVQDFNTTLFSLQDNKQARIQTANDYLQAGEIAPVGQYTGVSANNNLIVIMAESFEWYAVSEQLTPTLHALKTQNVSMNNYYSKSKTNISEAFGFLGSYPLAQTFSSVLPGVAKLSTNNFNYSLPNLLKQQGYIANNYFINHKKNFYGRSLTYSNFGFEHIYDVSDFEIENPMQKWADWSLDSDFFKAAIDEIAPANQMQPFFNWITTMSMHGPYEGNYRFEPYFAKMQEVNWQNPYAGTEIEHYYKHYTAAVMDLDRAIEYLLQELENRNLLDTTTVVIYSDHETYYHDLGISVKGIEKKEYQNPEIYRVPFLIYDNNLPAMQINDFSSPYDIMPTIMDLLGISYNKNMYMGSSVLNEHEKTEVFWSLTGGVFNKDLFTTNGLEVSEINAVTEQEKEVFLMEVEKIIEKILIFNDLYNYNLFGN
jgi:phosphoglycerol transferase MdoB-like AlkP superfamily enzyme